MQEVLECEQCGKKLVSLWPFVLDPGSFVQLTGFQDPEMDHTRVPNYPYPIQANAINITIHETFVRINVFCPECNHDGGSSIRISRPKPRNLIELRAKIRRFCSWLFDRRLTPSRCRVDSLR